MLLKVNIKWHWIIKAERKAFDKMKELLNAACAMTHFDSLPWTRLLPSCSYGAGSVMAYVMDDGSETHLVTLHYIFHPQNFTYVDMRVCVLVCVSASVTCTTCDIVGSHYT